MLYQSTNTDRTILHAGSFSAWLRTLRATFFEGRGMRVPCGECNACCRASHFIHIGPEETKTIGQIPSELLFPAPLHPAGHLVMGYDEHCRCPMLVKNNCSIYRHRPSTCRSFDCRILAASGVEIGDSATNPILQQARRWKFSFPTIRDQRLYSAVQNAAIFLKDHPHCLKEIAVPEDSIQIAVVSIKVYPVFLRSTGVRGKTLARKRDSEVTQQVIEAFHRFEKRMHTV